MERVNEGSTAYITATFKDVTAPERRHERYLPDTRRSQPDGIEGGNGAGRERVGGYHLTPAVNRIIRAANALEVRVVTVKAIYGDADAVIEEYRYQVKNLRFVTT